MSNWFRNQLHPWTDLMPRWLRITLSTLIVAAAAGIASADEEESPDPHYGEYVEVDELPVALNKPSIVDLDCVGPGFHKLNDGAIVVHALVGRDGHVKETRLTRGIDPCTDQTAVAMVRQYVFKPALSNGKPVAIWVAIPVRFSLLSSGGGGSERPVPPTGPQRFQPSHAVWTRALCDSLDAIIMAVTPATPEPEPMIRYADSATVCLHGYADDAGNERLGHELRERLLRLGWREVVADSGSNSPASNRAYRRGNLVVLVSGIWDRDPNDDVTMVGSMWQIEVRPARVGDDLLVPENRKRIKARRDRDGAPGR